MRNFKTFKRRKSDRIDALRLHQLAANFKADFGHILDAFYAKSEKHLEALSTNAEADADVYMNALMGWRASRTNVAAHLTQELDSWFDWREGVRPTLEEIEAAKRETAETEWSLMEDHSLEMSIAVERFSARAISRNSHHWDAMFQRLKVLTADRDLSEKKAPFNPYHLGEIVFDAIGKADIPFLIQSVIFRLFDDTAADKVNAFYQKQNEWLCDEGILPKLRDEMLHQTRPDTVDHAVINRITESFGNGGGNGVVIDPTVLQNLLTSVSALQAQSENIPDVSDLGAVKAWASQQAQTVTQQFKGSDKSDTIALVSMLFEYFFADGQLVDQMKHLLAKMQIPIIKVAILDSGFFENNQHPARLLLNKMARAASGWQPDEDLENDALLTGMESIVARLNKEFEEDIGLFNELLVIFDELKARYDEKRELALAETRRREQQLLAEHDALDRARVLLNTLLTDATLPASIQTLLDTDWYRLMRFILEKQGENQNWRNSARIAKELVWSLQPVAYVAQAERFETIVPKMLGGLEDGLRALGYDEARRDDILQVISEVHQEHQKAATEESIHEAIDEHLSLLDEQIEAAEQLIQGPIPLAVDEPQQKDMPGDLNYYLDEVGELEEGQWFNQQGADNHHKRICLSMIVADGAKYVFTDADGQKSIERSAIGLALALRDEQLVPFDNDNLIDRTLKTVAEALPDSELRPAG